MIIFKNLLIWFFGIALPIILISIFVSSLLRMIIPDSIDGTAGQFTSINSFGDIENNSEIQMKKLQMGGDQPLSKI